MAVLKYSIVVPLHNEQENVTDLYARLKSVMEASGETFEMVLVATALQGGYVLGIVGQWALRSHRALPQRWPEKTTAAPDSAF